jgi:hypothetical protein
MFRLLTPPNPKETPYHKTAEEKNAAFRLPHGKKEGQVEHISNAFYLPWDQHGVRRVGWQYRNREQFHVLSIPGWATETPSGTVSLRFTSVAARVGVQWGQGGLTYIGQTCPFSVQGLEPLGSGYSEISAEGTVYNLTRLEDLADMYASTETRATAGSGVSAVTVKNPNCKVLSLRTRQEGAKLTLVAGSVNIGPEKAGRTIGDEWSVSILPQLRAERRQLELDSQSLAPILPHAAA